MGLVALGLYLNSQNELNIDDFYEGEEISSSRLAGDKNSDAQSQDASGASRSPASVGGDGLAFTDSKESTLSNASPSPRRENLFDREREDDDSYADPDNRRNGSNSRAANAARDYSSQTASGYFPPPSPMINNEGSSSDSFSDNSSNSSFGETDRGDYLAGSITSNTETNDAPKDTDDFETVGGGSDSTQSAGAPDVAPICQTDKASGTYISEFNINLTCNQPAKIYYCIGTSGSCCDPTATPTEYTGTIALGSVDDNYCLSFYGQSTTTLLTSDQLDVGYLVNSTLPAIMTDFPKVQVQTTELPLMAHTQSTDYGIANHFLHQINTKEHDPSALVMNCDDVLYDYSLLSGASATLLDYDVSGLTPNDQIDQQIGKPSLQYGDNFFTTILEDRDRMLMGCQQQNIILKDFQIFTTTASAPATPSSSGAFGGFVSFGHFEATPNTTVAGSGESDQTTQILEEGFLAITH